MNPRETRSCIFVYGTLRRDAPMHALLGEEARFLGLARFRGRLWDCGAFPAVTDSAHEGDRVHGELYELQPEACEDVLARLDRYEGEGFERSQREIALEDGRICVAWIYLFLGSTRGARRIPSGDYVAELRS